MFTRRTIARFKSAMREIGEPCRVVVGDMNINTKGVFENANKRFILKYDNEGWIHRHLGKALERDKIAFIPYYRAIETSKGNIIVVWRQRHYVVLSHSTMKLGSEPVYIWVLLREVSAYKEGYYDDIEAV